MSKTVIVGCRLPHGLVIEHPVDASKKVTLNGKNKIVIIGAEYATTEVDAEFWDQWIAANSKCKALDSGAIFVAKSAADAQSIAKDLIGEKTGFEPMRQDGKDERASGVVSTEGKE